MSRTGSKVQLPNELLSHLSKYLDGDVNAFSLALSGSVDEFSSFYGQERGKHGIVIGPKCFFLTPSSWGSYFKRYIYPEMISSFNASNCYWIPGAQLFNNSVKMKNLLELNINGTKVSLPQLAKLLKTCQKITKLDFSYTHKMGEENKKQLSTPTAVKAFKKLTFLKISTSVLNARDYSNDPWVFIIKILSWCQNCKELTVDIAYEGESCGYHGRFDYFSPTEKKIKRGVRKDIALHTDWMTSLSRLILINSGPSTNYSNFLSNADREFRSRLLDDLLDQVLSTEQLPRSFIQHLWIQGFHFHSWRDSILSVAPSLKAYRGHVFFNSFRDLEHMGDVEFCLPPIHLPNLKSAYGYFFDYSEPEELLDFIQSHPNLERFHIFYVHYMSPKRIPFYVSNSECQLLKLKSLFCAGNTIIKEMVDEFVVVYPNIESLHLENLLVTDSRARSDVDCLSSIRFKALTSLSLKGFHADEGTFLLPIITHCPKLESVVIVWNDDSRKTFASITKAGHFLQSLFGRQKQFPQSDRFTLDTVISPTSPLVSNLAVFLKKATKLRDFKLQLNVGKNFPDVLFVFKSLLCRASHLERLVLIFENNKDIPYSGSDDHPLVDFLVQFALKMKRLTCLCMTFNKIDPALIQEVKRRLTEDVLPSRPSFWFHLGRELPKATDPGVPPLHYHEMIYVDKFNPPSSFWLDSKNL